MNRIIILLLCLLFATAPVVAQSPEATPVVIVNDTPIVAPDEIAPTVDVDVILPPGGGIDNGTIVAVGALLLAAVTAVVSITRGASADKAVTVSLQAIQANREAMSRYEAMYAESQFTVRQGFDAVTSIVRAFAPLTPWELDDELADTLEDVQTPGAPNVPPAA